MEGNGQIDYRRRRLSALAAYDGLYAGAGHKVLYAFLERVVPQQWSLTGRTLSQMALSQLVHTPIDSAARILRAYGLGARLRQAADRAQPEGYL